MSVCFEKVKISFACGAVNDEREARNTAMIVSERQNPRRKEEKTGKKRRRNTCKSSHDILFEPRRNPRKKPGQLLVATSSVVVRLLFLLLGLFFVYLHRTIGSLFLTMFLVFLRQTLRDYYFRTLTGTFRVWFSVGAASSCHSPDSLQMEARNYSLGSAVLHTCPIRRGPAHHATPSTVLRRNYSVDFTIYACALQKKICRYSRYRAAPPLSFSHPPSLFSVV